MAGIIEKFWKSKRQVVQIKIIRRFFIRKATKSFYRIQQFFRRDYFIDQTIGQSCLGVDVFACVNHFFCQTCTNQDHRLSRWFALPLEGAITSCACKRIESPPSALLSQLPPLAAIFICSLLLFHP